MVDGFIRGKFRGSPEVWTKFVGVQAISKQELLKVECGELHEDRANAVVVEQWDMDRDWDDITGTVLGRS